MINLGNPEFAEIKNAELPDGEPEELRSYLVSMRKELCEKSDFKISTHQRFLRRVLSPDSPARNLLMVHGTGVGKTCTAIQIAEEYILRPEFQDKKVLVISSGAVEQNFRTQIFEMDRVNIDAIAGTLESKQCTGRRYLDMLLRIEKEPKNWLNPDTRDKLNRTADRIINEFYEFQTYATFGSDLVYNLAGSAASRAVATEWVEKNLKGRLIIIDEAHNIRESNETKATKDLSKGLTTLAQANLGVIFVFLTATPMFDSYKEIEFFVNLFRWNDGVQKPEESIKIDSIFDAKTGTLKSGKSAEMFKEWCDQYVSFVKGENPFTFPFRLPPPVSVTANLPKSYLGKPIGPTETSRYLPLVESQVAGIQRRVLQKERGDGTENEMYMRTTLAVFPENRPFEEVFAPRGSQYEYQVPPFLTPDELPNHAAKFKRVLDAVQNSRGVVLVYSNFVKMGAQLFAMALEEHGFAPALGEPLLTNPAYRGPVKGKYGLITAKASDADIKKMLTMAKSRNNVNGETLRVIVTSPIASEGIDFRYIRQIHILDPWWNMSRIEQVIGRGLRTCSHSALNFSDQNCTVYLHIVRHGGDRECYDEYTYRERVEPKAIKIARVRKVIADNAMDCPMQNTINTLPDRWRELTIKQTRAENNEENLEFALKDLMAPTFMNDGDEVVVCNKDPEEADRTYRPLSTYLDVRDEMLGVLADLFFKKAIWDRDELLGALKNYSSESVAYTLQQAIKTGFHFKDSFGRPALLESKGDLYALAPIYDPNTTMVERTTVPPGTKRVPLVEPEERKEEAPVEVEPSILDTKREEFVFPGNAKERFSREVLNSYVFDHLLTDEERKNYLRGRPRGLFLDRLYVNGEVTVLGHENTIPEELSPSNLTAYNAWSKILVDEFIANKDRLYGTVASNGKFAFSKVEVGEDGVARRFMQRQKQYRPIVCGTGAHQNIEVIKAFARTIDPDGSGIHPTVVTNENACIYAELLARREAEKEILARQEGRPYTGRCFWLTPQQTSVLFDSPENRKAFADTFPKK